MPSLCLAVGKGRPAHRRGPRHRRTTVPGCAGRGAPPGLPASPGVVARDRSPWIAAAQPPGAGQPRREYPGTRRPSEALRPLDLAGRGRREAGLPPARGASSWHRRPSPVPPRRAFRLSRHDRATQGPRAGRRGPPALGDVATADYTRPPGPRRRIQRGRALARPRRRSFPPAGGRPRADPGLHLARERAAGGARGPRNGLPGGRAGHRWPPGDRDRRGGRVALPARRPRCSRGLPTQNRAGTQPPRDATAELRGPRRPAGG